MNKERPFRILIIEDEPLLAQHLANRIAGESSRYEVVGLAQNGLEGLEMLAQHKPDIVFTDIQMPVMNGLDFLAEATQQYPNTKYVILSGFSDFQYAQAAIKYGVKEYLLKPVSDEDLQNTLSKMVTDIETSDVPGRYALFHTLLNQPSGKQAPEAASQRFHLALLTMGHYVSQLSYLPQDVEENFEALFNSIDFSGIAQNYLPAPLTLPTLVGTSTPNTRFLVFDDNSLSDEAFLDFCHFLHESLNNLPSLPPVVLTCHLGTLQAGELYQAGKSLNKYYHFHYSPWKPVVLQVSSNIAIARSYSALNFDAVVQAFQIGHYDSAQQALTGVLQGWHDNDLPVSQFYQSMQFLLQTLRRSCSGYAPEEWGHLMQDSSFYFFFSLSFQDFCRKIFELLANMFQIQKNEWSADSLVEGVHMYIDEHYRDPINICDLAAQFYISPSHLSRQFKALYGCTPIQYLIDLRISQACKLLKENPDMEAKTVSTLVGYNDQFHFSKIFKKHTGCTPSDYRKNAT